MAAPSRSDRRRGRRRRRRIPCELEHAGQCVKGMVLDVSEHGLFVQVSTPPPPGTTLRLQLRETARTPPMQLVARVARGLRVPPQLAGAVAGGIGLWVVEAPPEFAGLRVEPGVAPTPSSAPAGADAQDRPDASRPRYRVRLQTTGGVRSRQVDVSAASDAEARRAALAGAGAGWQVKDLRRLT